MKQVIGERGRLVAPLEKDKLRSGGIEHTVDRPVKARTPPREREAALLVGHRLHYRDLPQWVAFRLHLDLPVCGHNHILQRLPCFVDDLRPNILCKIEWGPWIR